MIQYANRFAAFLSLIVLLSGSAFGQTPSGVAEAPARHIELDGQPNFRDLGGYQTTDGRTVKWREVFRSGELPHLSDSDVEKLANLRLRTVVNFLTQPEIAKEGPDRLPAGVRVVPLPMETGNLGNLAGVIVEARRTGDFSQVPPDINPEIHRSLIDEGAEYYAALLREAMDPANRPLAFHCSGGIHRTGTGAAILLSALGVPWETVREDYLLSNECRKGVTERRIEELKQLDARNRGVPVEQIDDANIRAFYVLEGAYIDAALEAAVEKHGSMDAYIREGLGLSDEEVQRLRSELLED